MSRSLGVTLIEAIIAMAIVGLVSMSTLSMLTFSHIHNDMEQERARAHQIVTEEMERVRRQLYTRVTGGSAVTIWDNGTPDNTDDDTEGTITVILTDSTGTPIVTTPSPPVRVTVEVTLTWNPRGRLQGKTMRETVMSYVTP